MKEETSANQDQKENLGTKRFNKLKFKAPDTLVTVVAVLVVIAGIQVFQTQQLLAAVASGSVNTTARQGASSVLPSQVGGCG